MPSESTQPHSALDYYYKEYVRLNERVDKLVDSSFSDFALLGAIGFLLVWPPVAQLNIFETSNSGRTLLIGFIGILMIVTIVGVRDIIKQSVIFHYIDEITALEEELRLSLSYSDERAFQFWRHWIRHGSKRWMHVYMGSGLT